MAALSINIPRSGSAVNTQYSPDSVLGEYNSYTPTSESSPTSIPSAPIKSQSSNNYSTGYSPDSIRNEYNAYTPKFSPQLFRPISSESKDINLNSVNPQQFRPISSASKEFSLNAVNPSVLQANMRRELSPISNYTPKLSADKLVDKMSTEIRNSPYNFNADKLKPYFEGMSNKDIKSVFMNTDSLIAFSPRAKNNATFMGQYNQLKRIASPTTSPMSVIPDLESRKKGGKFSKRRRHQGQRKTFKKNKGRKSRRGHSKSMRSKTQKRSKSRK